MLRLFLNFAVGSGSAAQREHPLTPPPRSLWALLMLGLLDYGGFFNSWLGVAAYVVGSVSALVAIAIVVRWMARVAGYQVDQAMGGAAEGYHEARAARIESDFMRRMADEAGGRGGRPADAEGVQQ